MNTNVMQVVYNRYETTPVRRMSVVVPEVLSNFIYDYTEQCHRTVGYKSMFRIAANHIAGYSQKIGQVIYTDSVTEQVFEDFVYYLQSERKLMGSTVRSIIERVKCMLNKAYNAGYPVSGSFRDYTFKDDEIDSVFLTMSDITRMYYFANLPRKEEEVRDYFIIGCLTGLRYSDYSRLTADNFIDGKIQIRTKKNKTPVLIPQHRFVKEILRKYSNRLPPARCIQYFNQAIKKICKRIGFTELIPYERRIGTEFVSVMRPKYSLISSHTARRSAATNMFLAGIPTYRIMLLTGHKTEVAFFRYIKITREENAMALSGNHFFN